MSAKRIFCVSAGVALLLYLILLPGDLFKGEKYSTVVTDRNGELLGARVAEDGQWRFPPGDSVPEKYAKALVQFEDRYFRYHLGVNPVSLVRACAGNIRAGRVTSGGSTITMQVIRMSRGKKRTVWEKFVEALIATRLEIHLSKDEIISLYAAHAPFGGNVVGLEAASRRYFGRPSKELSWGEAASLAVLPNAPSSIRPGKNRDKLKIKRDRLLKRLYERGEMDEEAFLLACDEPVPDSPHPLPSYAPHLTEYWWKKSKGGRISTDIDIHLQERVENILDLRNDEFAQRGIGDLAAIVIDVKTGGILAYCGNANPQRERPGGHVDIIRSPRSTGSILKPFLYCAMLQEGLIPPYALLPDIPVNINGFTPQNYDLQFNGAVRASEALRRSLNVPSVHMLRMYGVPKFYNLLKEAGMTTLTRDASDYGLSLILGGAEGSLLDITTMYASMAKAFLTGDNTTFPLKDRMAIWYTFDALKDVNRPDEIDWRMIPSVRKVAWKTGTSYGFRDAWAVGVTPGFAVGVWAGNAEGQGVPFLTGASTAGPVMFDIFNALPSESQDTGKYSAGGWFLEPEGFPTGEVCSESGFLKGPFCPDTETLPLPAKALKSPPCPYHKMEGGREVFVLPPAMEWYYKKLHPEYVGLGSSQSAYGDDPMEFIYPENGDVIYLPRQMDGNVEGAVFTLAHRNENATVYWHLDNEYIGSTRFIHQMKIKASEGRHTVTAVDENGAAVSVSFNIGSGVG